MWAVHPWCRKCGTLLTLDLCQIDHIVARVNGGEDNDGNCQVLCIPCHAAKTEQDMGYVERTKFDASGRVVW
jgi:5-methylcytosine-specific restriction protein A